MLTGAVVLVTGATGPAGRATCAALVEAGATVVAVGRDEQKLLELAGTHPEVADPGDAQSCLDLAARVRDHFGRIDGLVHLVGGWRGGPRFTANTDADWTAMSSASVDTLRHMSIAVHDDLAASDRGRAVIISSTAVDSPTPGAASYAAAKAAAEMWQRAFAESLRRSQSGRKSDPVPQTSAAATLVVMALVDQAMRDAEPGRTFAGFTEVSDLARQIVGLWAIDPVELNGSRIRA